MHRSQGYILVAMAKYLMLLVSINMNHPRPFSERRRGQSQTLTSSIFQFPKSASFIEVKFVYLSLVHYYEYIRGESRRIPEEAQGQINESGRLFLIFFNVHTL